MHKKTTGSPDISVVITAHREGVIVGPTAASAMEAIKHVQDTLGKTVEVIVILDRADEVTRAILTHGLGGLARIVETDEGDPGQARNQGTDQAQGEYICFLDGDDLWSYNWLAEAYKFVEKRPDVVAHPHCNVVFGREKCVWWHIDSEGPHFDPKYLEWGNYWDALTFARTEIYRRFRFLPNDLETGFGHEDWHWNCATIAAGVAHKAVPNTAHFKRRRERSVSAKVNERLGTVRPLQISNF